MKHDFDALLEIVYRYYPRAIDSSNTRMVTGGADALTPVAAREDRLKGHGSSLCRSRRLGC